jgi:hypothetical protein
VLAANTWVFDSATPSVISESSVLSLKATNQSTPPFGVRQMRARHLPATSSQPSAHACVALPATMRLTFASGNSSIVILFQFVPFVVSETSFEFDLEAHATVVLTASTPSAPPSSPSFASVTGTHESPPSPVL